MPDAHLQFCHNGQDVTADMYASQDANEVRAWRDDGTCLGAVTLHHNGWRASASDVCDWTEYRGEPYEGWQGALAALLAVSGHHGEVPESEWKS
jgi:hypothetical protein